MSIYDTLNPMQKDAVFSQRGLSLSWLGLDRAKRWC